MTRQWCAAADALGLAQGRMALIKHGVLVEDGADGEPSAEYAIRLATAMLAAALPVELTHAEAEALGSDQNEAFDIAALAVLRRALDEEAR